MPVTASASKPCPLISLPEPPESQSVSGIPGVSAQHASVGEEKYKDWLQGRQGIKPRALPLVKSGWSTPPSHPALANAQPDRANLKGRSGCCKMGQVAGYDDRGCGGSIVLNSKEFECGLICNRGLRLETRGLIRDYEAFCTRSFSQPEPFSCPGERQQYIAALLRGSCSTWECRHPYMGLENLPSSRIPKLLDKHSAFRLFDRSQVVSVCPPKKVKQTNTRESTFPKQSTRIPR